MGCDGSFKLNPIAPTSGGHRPRLTCGPASVAPHKHSKEAHTHGRDSGVNLMNES